MNGFLQRMNDKIRKHSLGFLGIFGDEPDLDIQGIFLWRGSELPVPMVEHP
jgi:elongation factor 1-gamma